MTAANRRQIYGSNQIELSWTVIPILIVVMLFLATARVILRSRMPKPAGCDGCNGDRPSILVGVSLSQAWCGHGERTARSGQRSGEAHADLSCDVVGRYGSQLLGAAPWRARRT